MTNLFDPAGKPFGWAHHAERDHIRKHMEKRLGRVEPHSWDAMHRESRVSDIQRRLHKYDETFAVRSRRWAEEQRLRCAREATDDDLRLTWEELQHLVDLFDGANDPLSIEIARKAAESLQARAAVLASQPNVTAARP